MKRGGLEAAHVVVLTANITLRRGGIWNLAFKGVTLVQALGGQEIGLF